MCQKGELKLHLHCTLFITCFLRKYFFVFLFALLFFSFSIPPFNIFPSTYYISYIQLLFCTINDIIRFEQNEHILYDNLLGGLLCGLSAILISHL